MRNILGSFLFSNDTVEKKVEFYFWGEIVNGLIFCKLLLEGESVSHG